jgi:serine/threonine-protein kinase
MTSGSESDRRLARLVSCIGEQFEFLSLLGEGGSGTVYEVINRALDRREALKVLSDSFLEEQAPGRFSHEAKVAASLDHPNIVKVHAFGQEDGIHWFSMQLVDGPSLAQLLEAALPFDETMLLRFAIPILDALEFSHTRGVIHRDIKPANILFNSAGCPFLTDFGVAKTEGSVLKTRTGHLLGTPAYVSPEQAMGEVVDARADQYSFGITLYKTLTGHLPFTADSTLQTLVLRLKEDPEPIVKHRADLDPELSEIIMRSLARERALRWDSITAMKDALLRHAERRNLPWNHPLEQVSGFPLSQRPLPAIKGRPSNIPQASPASGSFEPTMDLPMTKREARGWLFGAAMLPVVAWIGWLVWSRRDVSPLPPSVAQVSVPQPVPEPAPIQATPASKPLPPAAKKPESATIASTRRPAVYPQLLEGSPVATTTTTCGGLRVNVSLVIAENGSVKSCKVLSNLKPECAEAAQSAAMRYRFKPALDAQGQPLETTIAAAVDFPETP